MTDFKTLLDFLLAMMSATGPWALLGFLFTGLLRIYQLDLVQNFLRAHMPKLAWENQSEYTKLLAPFLLAFLGVLLPGLFLSHMALSAALLAAFEAGLVAIGFHKGTKDLGYAMTASALKSDPQYQPGPIRQALSPVLPVDRDMLIAKLTPPAP